MTDLTSQSVTDLLKNTRSRRCSRRSQSLRTGTARMLAGGPVRAAFSASVAGDVISYGYRKEGSLGSAKPISYRGVVNCLSI